MRMLRSGLLVVVHEKGFCSFHLFFPTALVFAGNNENLKHLETQNGSTFLDGS